MIHLKNVLVCVMSCPSLPSPPQVEVRSRFHELKGGLSIHGGRLGYSATTTRVFVGGVLNMTGGELKFVEVLPLAMPGFHVHSAPRNADRSFMTVTAELNWAGGTMKGNAEVQH